MGIATTTSPTQGYDLKVSSITKRVFLPGSSGTDDLLIATLETGLQIGGDSATAPATIHYVHTDHLTGSNVVTDEQRRLEETTDYYPFGEIKLDTTTTNFKRNMV